ncbi:MAG: cell envelope integrity protein TolA [Acidiferrobacterales bacterium]
MSAAAVHARPPARNAMAMGLALLVHVLLLGLIVLNWSSTPGRDVPVTIIQARAIVEKPLKVKSPDGPPDTKSPTVDIERDRTRERKRKQEVAKRKADRLKRKKIAKRREITKRKAAAAQRQKQAQEMLQKQLAAEEAERSQARQMAKVRNEAARYMDLIGKRVSSKWQRPPGSARDAYSVVRVRVTPGGRVLSVTVVRSSGDPAFDRATENAIYLAEPLPVPEDAEVFEILREFNIDTQKL